MTRCRSGPILGLIAFTAGALLAAQGRQAEGAKAVRNSILDRIHS